MTSPWKEYAVTNAIDLLGSLIYPVTKTMDQMQKARCYRAFFDGK